PALLGLVLALAAVAAGCGSTSNRTLRTSLETLRTPTPSIAAPAAKPGPETSCGDATASLRPGASLSPSGRMPEGSYMRTIQRRGRLIAGVDQNTLLFASLNPFTGRLQG